MGMVWSMGERKFRSNWKKKRRLFDALMQSVMMYGAEIWGWCERPEIERVQETYLRWNLGVDRSTPKYAVRNETGRYKLAVLASRRALKFEERMSKCEGGSIRKECWKLWTGGRPDTGYSRDRKNFLEKVGWSLERRKEELSRRENKWREMERKNRRLGRHEEGRKIQESNYL